MEKIGILIPVFNKLEYTKKCLQNLTDIFHSEKDIAGIFELIIVDDASTDGTSEWISSNYKQVHVLQGNGDLWWSGGINVGAKCAVEELKCSHVLLWNNDIEVGSAYFKTLVKLTREYDQNVIIGSKIYGNLEKQLVWSMGGLFNPRSGKSSMIGYAIEDNEDLQLPIEADWLTGMGTLVPVEVIEKIGYWDEVNYPQYNGDMEYTYRAKINGFRNIAVPGLKIWNDTENTGMTKKKNLKTVFRMLGDKRSLYYWKANIKFYKTYSESILAYFSLFMLYFKFFGGFFKWKILKLFGFKVKSDFI